MQVPTTQARTAQVHTTTVQASGQYVTIINKPVVAAMKALGSGDAAERAKQIVAVLAHPSRFAPPVLYALSEALFQAGKKDEAAFWFYAGQLRARFDANRCTDETAGSAVDVLNDRYGPAINKYTLTDIPKLEALIPRVIAWDRKTGHVYDPRWLAPHGMAPFLADGKAAPLTRPQAEWGKIAEKNRAAYLSGFYEALAGMKKGGAAKS